MPEQDSSFAVIYTYTAMTLLILDNAPMILDRLAEYIQEFIPEVRIHKSARAADAIQWIDENKPDGIVMEWNLPDVRPADIIAHARKAGPQSSIIVLSHFIDDALETQCRQLGVDFLFDKYDEFQKIPAVLGTTV